MLWRWIINAVSIYAATLVVDGIAVRDAVSLILAAALLGIVNAVIRPVLMLLTLPLNIMTLGLFTFVLNALLLWLVSAFVSGFVVEGFVAALLGSLLISLVSAVLSLVIR